MKKLNENIYHYGIHRLNLKERNIAVAIRLKYKKFCDDIVLKKPEATLLYLCISAFLTLQFYMDYPKQDLPAENFMGY